MLRPGVVLGRGDQLLKPLARLVRLGVAPDLPGQEFSFVDVRDLAALIAQRGLTTGISSSELLGHR